MALSEPKIISLPKIYDPRGSLTFVQNAPMRAIPFDIERVYWVYDVPGGECRGAHSHKCCQEFIIAASGSFTVTLTDGTRDFAFHLHRPYEGLYVPTGWWRDLQDFSSGSVCLVMASRPYEEDDYIRDFEQYLAKGGDR